MHKLNVLSDGIKHRQKSQFTVIDNLPY